MNSPKGPSSTLSNGRISPSRNHLGSGWDFEVQGLRRHHFHGLTCQRSHQVKLFSSMEPIFSAPNDHAGCAPKMTATLRRLLQSFRIGIELPKMLGQGQVNRGVVLSRNMRRLKLQFRRPLKGSLAKVMAARQIGSCITFVMDDLWEGTQVDFDLP